MRFYIIFSGSNNIIYARRMRISTDLVEIVSTARRMWQYVGPWYGTVRQCNQRLIVTWCTTTSDGDFVQNAMPHVSNIYVCRVIRTLGTDIFEKLPSWKIITRVQHDYNIALIDVVRNISVHLYKAEVNTENKHKYLTYLPFTK